MEGLDVKTLSQEVVIELVSTITNNKTFLTLLNVMIDKVIGEKLFHINQMQEKLAGENHDLHVANKRLSEKINEMEQRQTELFNREHSNRVATMEQQQYSRRNCLLITGIPESNEKDSDGNSIREDTDKVVIDLAQEKLGIKLTEQDLDRTHRATRVRRTDGKPRAIIAKFSRYNVRDKVIRARTKLKGSRIGIQELLTNANQVLLDQAKTMVKTVNRAKAAWSWDGYIYILMDIKEGKTRRHLVRSEWDIKDLERSYNCTV